MVEADRRRQGHKRVMVNRPAAVVLAPDTQAVDCYLVDISEGGACLWIGTMELSDCFVLRLTPSGSVYRICKPMWRDGELAGVRFVSAKMSDGIPHQAHGNGFCPRCAAEVGETFSRAPANAAGSSRAAPTARPSALVFSTVSPRGAPPTASRSRTASMPEEEPLLLE